MSKVSLKNILAELSKQQTTASGLGGDFLPLPIANRFIDFVNDANYCRQLFKVLTMTSKTLDMPKILSRASVYYEPTETTAAVRTTFSTGNIRFTAKKLFSKLEASSGVLEDAAFDMEQIIRDQAAEATGQAEEEAMMVGNTAATANATTPNNATATNWYQKDHRLIFDGLFTIGGASGAATSVNAGGVVASSSILRQVMYNLGKYGRVMSRLVAFLNPWSANQMLDDDKVVTMDKAGNRATIFTGALFLLYGKINVIDEVYAPDGQGCMTPKNNPIIADRRKIRVEREKEIQQDMWRWVVSERIDFKVEHNDAVALVTNLDLPDAAS